MSRAPWMQVFLLFVLTTAASHAGSCKLIKFADLPVSVVNMQPLARVDINGMDASLLVDTGATWNLMSRAGADRYKLRLGELPDGLRMWGVNGAVSASLGVAKLTIVGTTFKRMEFVVGGTDFGADGVLGRNLLMMKDLELDLGKGMVRIMGTQKCEHANLAYWTKPGETFSVADIELNSMESIIPAVTVDAYVNGIKIRAMLDSGSAVSLIKQRVAEKAGVKNNSPGAAEGGYIMGVGRRLIESYVGPFASFKVGDNEEVKNTRLRFGDFDLEADMLLGADFMLSHHIFIAQSTHRMYFTYNGGAVFNLNKLSAAAGNNTQAAAPPSVATEKPTGDAGELARQGAAAASRNDLATALTDLNSAVAIDPANAEYHYQRGNLYRANGQPELARADFDQALALRADFVAAYLARAEIRLSKNEFQAALEDLNSADPLAAPGAGLRLKLADLYLRLDRPRQALAQFTPWMNAHRDDAKWPQAAAGRCYARVLANEDISGALGDCNSALRNINNDSDTLAYLHATRALARFRQGDYKRALADANEGLKLAPENPRARFVRALVESHLNQKSECELDLQAADKAAPKIQDYFKQYGLTP